jgi:farnesyl-diphosphate farnesyltransferase
MGKTWDLLTHPTELRAVIQYSIWHEPLHPRDPSKESDDMRRCYALLKKTSRSFAMVLEELHPELRTLVLPQHFSPNPPILPFLPSFVI